MVRQQDHSNTFEHMNAIHLRYLDEIRTLNNNLAEFRAQKELELHKASELAKSLEE